MAIVGNEGATPPCAPDKSDDRKEGATAAGENVVALTYPPPVVSIASEGNVASALDAAAVVASVAVSKLSIVVSKPRSAAVDFWAPGGGAGWRPSLIALTISAALHFEYLIFSSISESTSPKTFSNSKKLAAATKFLAVFLIKRKET